MGWEVLVIPIIGVAVWIISTVIRSAEEAKRGGPPAAKKRPEKVTDLDRFLREVKRRREPSEGEEPRPRRVEREAEDERIERRRPRPSPPSAVVEEAIEAIPVVIPVEAVPVAQPFSAAPVMRTIEAPPLPTMPSEKSAAPLQQQREQVAAAGLKELLQSRDGLRKAMILREVLGPPLARRAGRFPRGSSS
jgi:hypothetical protein